MPKSHPHQNVMVLPVLTEHNSIPFKSADQNQVRYKQRSDSTYQTRNPAFRHILHMQGHHWSYCQAIKTATYFIQISITLAHICQKDVTVCPSHIQSVRATQHRYCKMRLKVDNLVASMPLTSHQAGRESFYFQMPRERLCYSEPKKYATGLKHQSTALTTVSVYTSTL